MLYHVSQKITWTLSLLEEFDIVPSLYFKKLTGTEDIWECRIQVASAAYRIFCFFDGKSVVVLTHGFVKKTPKTPHREIGKAAAFGKDHLKRRLRK